MTQSQLMSWPGCSAPERATDLAAAAIDLFNESLSTSHRPIDEEQAARYRQLSLNAIDAQVQQLEPIAATLPALQKQKLQQRRRVIG